MPEFMDDGSRMRRCQLLVQCAERPRFAGFRAVAFLRGAICGCRSECVESTPDGDPGGIGIVIRICVPELPDSMDNVPSN